MKKSQSNTSRNQKFKNATRKNQPAKDNLGLKLLNNNHGSTSAPEGKLAVNNNVIFKKLLYLTSIRSDNDTVIQLFAEQGMTIDSKLISAWSSSNNSQHYKAMPDEALTVFLDALFSIRKECKENDINIFDLNKIFEDIREEDKKDGTQAA